MFIASPALGRGRREAAGEGFFWYVYHGLPCIQVFQTKRLHPSAQWVTFMAIDDGVTGLMRYSLNTIQVILKANHCSAGLPPGLDQATPLTYHYPPAALTRAVLLQDTLDYLRSGGVSARRVCFLLPSSSDTTDETPDSAVIIDFSAIQSTAAVLMQERMPIVNPTNVGLCHALYERVEIWVLGSMAYQSSAFSSLMNLCQTAYGNVRFQLQPVDPAPHANLVLTECILNILQAGQIDTIHTQAADKRHRKACARAVLNQLNACQRSDPSVYLQVTEHLRVLFKYVVLRQARQAYRLEELEQLSSIQRSTIQMRDEAQKRQIYMQPFADLKPLIESLSLDPLVALLEATSLDKCLAYLENERRLQLQDLKQWEQHFAQLAQQCSRSTSSWRTQTYHVGQHSLQHLYQYSLIGLGASLTPWLGHHTASWFTAFPLGQSVAETVTQWVRPTSLLKGCQFVGGGLGALATYTIGGYGLGKSLIMGLLAQRLKAYLNGVEVNDEEARLIVPTGYMKDSLSCLRLAGLMIASVETLATGNLECIIHALGGWVGSASAVALAKQVITDLQEAGTAQMTENQAVALLFIGLGGYDLGRWLSDYGYQGVDKQFARERLTQAFCTLTQEKNFMGCTTDFSEQPLWSPKFWLNPNDSVRMGWTVNGTFQDAACEVIKLTDGERAVVCDVLTPMQRLPLH